MTSARRSRADDAHGYTVAMRPVRAGSDLGAYQSSAQELAAAGFVFPANAAHIGFVRFSLCTLNVFQCPSRARLRFHFGTITRTSRLPSGTHWQARRDWLVSP